jgi:hypothetical protein
MVRVSLGQTRKSGDAILTSVLPSTADIRQRGGHVRKAQIAAISAKVASWPDQGSEAASLFRGEMSDRPRVRQRPALI